MTFDELTIETTVCRPVAGPELIEPFEEEIRQLYEVAIASHRYDREPTAAGMQEIAILLSVTASSSAAIWALKVFFEPTVTEAGERFRDWVFRVNRGARRSKVSDREYIPLIIALGANSGADYPATPVRYVFLNPKSTTEVEEMLRAANQHLKELPDHLFEQSGGPTENAFFWDPNARSWRGNVMLDDGSLYGEVWMPQIYGLDDPDSVNEPTSSEDGDSTAAPLKRPTED
jgi:hypothetical protein